MIHPVLEKFEARFGPAGRPLSMLIRPAVVAPPKRTLVWGDWSAIEARILPWLADSPGSREVLDVFRESDADTDMPDIYMREAGNIHGMKPTMVTDEQRQEGKVAVLSLGFGGARGALQAMAAGYGLSLTDDEADRIVSMWRDNNRWARRFWDELWEAFQNAMEDAGTTYTAGRCTFLFDKDYMRTMMMFLPDGRPLRYPQCRWGKRTVVNEMGDEEEKYGLLYRRGDETRSLWYGVLAENATQATAGSRLRAALVDLCPAPFLDGTGAEMWPDLPGEVIGHTHDEIIAETDDDDEAVDATARWMYDAMMDTPDWMEGCPMAAEMSTNFYYSKSKTAVQPWRPA